MAIREVAHRGSETTYDRIKDLDLPQRGKRGHPRKWTQSDVLTAIELFVQRNGRPPSALDWDPGRARRKGHHWRARHFEAHLEYPGVKAVTRLFASWNEAIEAAGLPSRRVGSYPRLGGLGTHLRERSEEDR